MAELTYIRGVNTLTLDEAKCNGCRMCVEVCPHHVFESSEGCVRIARVDACMECGACTMNCPAGALSVNPGVGCALAVLKGWVTRSEPDCCS